MIKKYLVIISHYMALNFQTDVVYRFNFIFGQISILTYLVTFLLSLQYVFQEFPDIGGFYY